MGQYFILANLDKKEYINPHNLGGGLKFWEWCANNPARVVPFLLRKSSEGGGGDIQFESKVAGRWAGDRIVLIGDYDKSKLYDRVSKTFKEISKLVRPDFNKFIEIKEYKVTPDPFLTPAPIKKKLKKVI